MASNIISFRLTDKELDLLSQQQQHGESLSLTAARLVRERLGIVNSLSTDEFTTIDDLIDDKIKEIEPRLIETFKALTMGLEERITALEAKKTSVRRSTARRNEKVAE